MLGHRTIGRIVGAAFDPRHYKALIQIGLKSGAPAEVLRRYLSGAGSYPYSCGVKTPLGLIRPTLYTYWDLLTLNEIFFRDDYPADAADQVVVDFGSNIGLSALYFLTRSAGTRCYMFEPDPRNIERLTANLLAFTSRSTLEPSAVSDVAGTAQFGLDVTSGRYGGLGRDFGHLISVRCVAVNDVLGSILSREGTIDILKIDVEGTEEKILNAIEPKHLSRIRKIYMEALPNTQFHPDQFDQEKSGTVCRLINKSLPPRT